MTIPRNLSNLAPGVSTAGVLNPSNGGTGTSTVFTLGSVPFVGASGVYAQANSQLFWDNTNSRLGLGRTSPSAKIDVNGGVRAAGGSTYGTGVAGYSFDANGDTDGGMFSPADGTVTFATNNAERMRVDSNGYVMIGTTTPYGFLTVSGSGPTLNNQSFAYFATSGGAAVSGYASSQSITNAIWSSGRVSSIEFNAYSDGRLKKDITPIPTKDAWNLINNVMPIHYKWKENIDDGHKFGFIAQDLIKAGFSNLVGQYNNSNIEENIDEDGFISPAGISLTVNYDQIIPILATALRDVSAALAKKDIEIAELTARLDALEK